MIGLLMLGAVAAQTWETGNSLLRECQNRTLEPACVGYLDGVTDTDAALGRPVSVCLPQAVERGQVRDVVVKWLLDHPEQRHQYAPDLVIKALSSVFPCRGSADVRG